MDKIEVEILEDGTASVKTEGISDVNHFSADELLEAISAELGGEVITKQREHPIWKRHAVKRIQGKVRIVEV